MTSRNSICHCEHSEAIFKSYKFFSALLRKIAASACGLLAMTSRNSICHCEERRDEAISSACGRETCAILYKCAFIPVKTKNQQENRLTEYLVTPSFYSTSLQFRARPFIIIHRRIGAFADGHQRKQAPEKVPSADDAKR